jgi:hypothetical protein
MAVTFVPSVLIIFLGSAIIVGSTIPVNVKQTKAICRCHLVQLKKGGLA